MNQVSYDISQGIESLKQKSPEMFSQIHRPIVPIIADGDGMYVPEQDEYYALCGLSALDNIFQALKITKKSGDDITNILDFACGYGRVARVLSAAFPRANLTVCDADSKAVSAVASILPVEAVVGEIDLDNFRLDKTFDLIWVGSLFTHISSDYFKTVFDFLLRHLSDNGTLVFSTHGPYVADRVNTREKVYGLDEAELDGFLNDYNNLSYGFRPYPGLADYGISITKPSYIRQLIESKPQVSQILYRARGWVEHQDVIAVYKGEL